MKCYWNSKLHIDRREAEVNMNCLLFNNTSCSPKQKSTIVLFYKRLKGLSFRRNNAKLLLTLLHKAWDIPTLRC